MIRPTCLEEFEASFDLSSVSLGLIFDGLNVESFLGFTFFEDGEAQLFDLSQRAIKRFTMSDETSYNVTQRQRTRGEGGRAAQRLPAGTPWP